MFRSDFQWSFWHLTYEVINVPQVYLFSLLGSQSDSDSLASEEGVNDDNTDDELSKVVGGLEFAIDRQDKDSKVEDKKTTAEEGITPKDEKATEDTEKKPLHQLQSVSAQARFSRGGGGERLLYCCIFWFFLDCSVFFIHISSIIVFIISFLFLLWHNNNTIIHHKNLHYIAVLRKRKEKSTSLRK